MIPTGVGVNRNVTMATKAKTGDPHRRGGEPQIALDVMGGKT